MDQPKQTPPSGETWRRATLNEVALRALELARMALTLVASSATGMAGERALELARMALTLVTEAQATRRAPAWFDLELDLDAPDDRSL